MAVSRAEVGFREGERLDYLGIGEVVVLPNRDKVTSTAGGRILELVQQNPGAAIIYATGETMIPVYGCVAEVVRWGEVNFGATRAFHLDEYWPVDPEPIGSVSFVRYLRNKVWRPFGLSADQVFEINGLADDPEAEAARYDQLLSECAVDLAILGIGPGGHIGFNEPGTPFERRTSVVNLSAETIYRDRIERGLPTPDKAITQGIANILEARNILLVAYGERKGEWLRQALYGPIDVACPASALRLVGDKVTMVIDQEAAAVLSQGR